jgi:hypothetical protein
MYYSIENKILYYNEKSLPIGWDFEKVVDWFKDKGVLAYRHYDSLRPTRIYYKKDTRFIGITHIVFVREKK